MRDAGTALICVDDQLRAIHVGTELVDTTYNRRLYVADVYDGGITVEVEQTYTPVDEDAFGVGIAEEGEATPTVTDGCGVRLSELADLAERGRLTIGDVDESRVVDIDPRPTC